MEREPVTFGKFIEYSWKCLACVAVISGIFFLIWWGVVANIEEPFLRCEHDLFVALQGELDQTLFYEEDTQEVAQIMQAMRVSSGSANQVIDALIALKHFGVGDVFADVSTTKLDEEDSPRIRRSFNLLVMSSGGDLKKVFEKLVALEKYDRLTDAFYNVLEKRDVKVVQAMVGTLTDEDLPPSTKVPLFPLWVIITIWFGLTIPTFISYLYCREGNYILSPKKITTYVIVLFWLPATLPFIAIVGLYRLIILIIKGISFTRKKAREAIILKLSRRWCFIEGFENERELLRGKGIMVNNITIDQPRQLQGISFPESQLKKVFRILKVVQTGSEVLTDQPGVYLFECIGKHRHCFETKKEELRKDYLEVCKGSNLKKEITQLENQIECDRGNLETYSKSLVSTTRELGKERVKLASLKEELELAPQRGSSDEFDALCGSPYVEWMEVEPEVIKIYTRMIYTDFKDHAGKFRSGIYELGKFRISIHTDGKVRIRNLTHRKKDSSYNYDHPHVLDEKPCLGNIHEGITKLIANYQFALAGKILIKFLQTANTGWYYSITKWRRVGNENQ